MAYFYLKLKMHALNNYSGVMCHDNEEWFKNWLGIDLPAQNWYEELDKLWPKHLKISKICTLIGCFWTKYMFELKNYRVVLLDGTEYWCNIWRKEKLTCAFKNDIRNLANLHQSMFGSLKIETLMESFFYPKQKMHELKIYGGILCHDNKEWCKIWRGIDLLVQNWHEKFDEFWLEHLKISKICTLMGCFWTKYMFELKKSIGEFCLMALNIDATFERKLTCAFKNDMRNLANFHQSMFESLKIGNRENN